MAEEFAQHGHMVMGCSRVADRARCLGAPHRLDTVDVAEDAQVQAWSHTLVAEYGPPDLLINNAGVINRNAPLWEVPVAEFDQVIDVNIKGTANVIRHFLPAMLARGAGVIVNFSSGWGRSTSPEVAPYCASKWAIEGLTQALAQELPKGLAVIALNPGIIDTEMLRSCFGEEAAGYWTANQWSKKAVPYLLNLGVKDNGRALSVPWHR